MSTQRSHAHKAAGGEELRKPAEGGEPANAEATAGAAPGDPAEAAGEPTPDARIAALEAELATAKDAALRAIAEAENTRKRAERQMQDTTRYAVADFARDILTVGDNLARALDAVPEAEAKQDEHLAKLREGVELTMRELQATLERHHITRIDPLGDLFDHNVHQAMFEVETEEHAPGAVAHVVQPGYLIHDRLLRPALVGVAKKASGAQAGEAGQADEKPDGDDAA